MDERVNNSESKEQEINFYLFVSKKKKKVNFNIDC